MTFATIWEFRVAPTARAEFERRYGRDGDWAALFRRSSEYVGTELWADIEEPGRYLTIDRWTSAEAYRQFRDEHAEEYAALDRACDALTLSELRLGELAESETRS